MKIRDRYTRGVAGAPVPRTERRIRAAEGPERAGTPLDRVQISERGREIRRARVLALTAPDVREDLVEEILAQIEQGEYRVSGAEVVPKLIREHWMLARGTMP